MTGTARQIHLNLFLPTTGHHEASWRHPGSRPGEIFSLAYYKEIAGIAERGKFDSLFLSDHLALGRNYEFGPGAHLEPLTLLSALAATTSRIGLIATASTSYTEPYNLARLFASLDHISEGRAGWNIVTSWSDAASGNFGRTERASHTERYARATEFVEVVSKLWDSWEDDAVVADRESGLFADRHKIHNVEHTGKYFKVNGALDVARSPQGYPVLLQAGSSVTGRAFAARYAEAIFTAQQDLGEAQAFYVDVKNQAKSYGRTADSIVILPGLGPIVGRTEAEAREIERELNEATIPQVGLRHIAARFDGVDLSSYPLDGPVPLHALPKPEDVQGAKSRSQLIYDLIEREKSLTLRQLLWRLAGARGHGTVVGTAEQVADRILGWVDQGASDGFNIMPPYLPGSLEDFVNEVVPILQQKGRFRTEYEGRTLRDHYGLNRPANRFANSRLAS
ncbi:LLM class flavin-dependent oxidoreductase [Shinella sp. S4-D37]|uniref:LLM class flavin-dependent oxidoreductase n=1 Tax=Shinella sp. S4-D37 TaxID=3161999 RepID=UPI0034665067